MSVAQIKPDITRSSTCCETQVPRAQLLADGHVHFHPGVDISAALDFAAQNFAAAARCRKSPAAAVGCLFLTESKGVFRFKELAACSGGLGQWKIQPAPDPLTLVARKETAMPLVVVAGRQIQTRERMEVLALGCAEHFGEGAALVEVVEEAVRRSWFCVLPWGFGKWSGRRAQYIRQLTNSQWKQAIYLGDNSGRLRWSRTPQLLRFSENGCIPVLPGTDPFPFASHVRRIGTYGFIAEGPIDLSDPASDIRKLITRDRHQPPAFGPRAGVFQFARDQIGIQIVKRFGIAL